MGGAGKRGLGQDSTLPVRGRTDRPPTNDLSVKLGQVKRIISLISQVVSVTEDLPYFHPKEKNQKSNLFRSEGLAGDVRDDSPNGVVVGDGYHRGDLLGTPGVPLTDGGTIPQAELVY